MKSLSALIYSVLVFFTLNSKVLATNRNLANKATFAGGMTEGLDIHDLECDVDVENLKSYAAVSSRVFGIKNICEESYVVAMSAIPEEVANEGFPMIRARIVDKCDECNEAQVILNHDAYKNFSKADSNASIIWMVINGSGDIGVKANYLKFHNFTEFVGIPPEEIKRIFELRALEMVENNINFRDWPWEGDNKVQSGAELVSSNNSTKIITTSFNDETENTSNGTGYVAISVSVVGAIGLVCFVGYKSRSRSGLERKDSLAIPSIPAVDSSINSVSDHPDGLPRIDIYNPPLEYYHFPMDTSYDIVDLRPEIYED